jgi:hypothetical protein
MEGNPHEFSALNHCRPNLEAAIAERKPRCIVALGGIATRELTGLAGEQQGVSHLAGYVLPYISRSYQSLEYTQGDTMADARAKAQTVVPVIPNFHPAYLRRGKSSHHGVFSRILNRAMNIAKGRDTAWAWDVDPDDSGSWRGLDWILFPTNQDLFDFYSYCQSHPELPIAKDFETAESTTLDEDAREGFQDTQITQAQFAIMVNGRPRCIAVRYDDETCRGFIHAMLHLPNQSFGHNWWVFDERVARASAAREGWSYAPTTRTHDTLQMFHHWQPDLPAHLQFASSFINFPFPWKHLAASHIEFYGCADVHSDLLLGNMLLETLRRDRLWGDETIGYFGQVYAVRPILDDMQDRGVPIDDDERLKLSAKFDIEQERLLKEIQSQAPKECGRVHPKEGYKGTPPEMKPFVNTLQLQEEMDRHRLESGDDPETYHYEIRNFPIAVAGPNNEPEMSTIDRWCRVYDFNPNSRPQVLDYMRVKGHPVPKSREEDDDGNRKDTTGEKELRRLAAKTGDHFYLRVVEYRGFTKLKGTYIEGFKPGADGLVHPTFNFDTAIGQLTAKNPNSQNFPKLKPTVELAKQMRAMIAAKPGKILTSWDYKSFHALTLGFLAEDATWIRLARLDIHSFVAGHVLGLWDGPTIFKESDEQLMSRFKWLKSDPDRKRVRDDQAKHGILGIGNGLSAKGLYERYTENFPPTKCSGCSGTGRVAGARIATTKKCSDCNGTGFVTGLRLAGTFLAALQILAPKVFAYQRNERKKAHEAGDRGYYTPFGFARRFYEVYSFSKGWDPARDAEPPHGDQAEQAVSYRHTNVAHCHLREVMKELDRKGLASRYGLMNQIHDDLMFHFDERLLDEHIRDVAPIFRAPSKVLNNAIAPDGLTVDVECSKGYNWRDMQPVDLAAFRNPTPVGAARL